MSLSVCCLTNGPAGRVRALLALFRPLADEIVVGVDAGADGAVISACGDLADSVVRVPYAPPPERYWAWLHVIDSAAYRGRIVQDHSPPMPDIPPCRHVPVAHAAPGREQPR